MPRGGARVRSGARQDRNSLRTDRRVEMGDGWIQLPAKRKGRAPAWPLPGSVPTGARQLWAQLWTRGEATQWEANGQHVQVALYVLAVLVASGPFASASDRNTALRYMDDLGLSNGGRRANRWVIDDGSQPAEQHQPEPRTPAADEPRRKDRLLELVVNQ